MSSSTLHQAAQKAVEALRHAETWIGSAPHGDNCYVSDHYEGDPGDRCNCGKESALSSVERGLEAIQQQGQSEAEKWERERAGCPALQQQPEPADSLLASHLAYTRAHLPALQHQEVPREPVAWLNPSSGKTCSADEKFSMENHQGMPGKAVAAHFSDPLYASPSTTRQQEVGSGRCEIEDCPELNMSNYDEGDVARLNDWAVRANAEIDRLRLALADTPDELKKGLAACPTSRGNLLEIEPNDRRDEASNRGTGEEEQRGGKAGRCDATRAGGAEFGACGSDTAQHEVMAVPGPSAPACWRPIETAPEDTHILIATTGDHVGTAYWTDEGDGKVWAWGHPQREGGDYVHQNLAPIGWMPLPAAPSTPENAGGVGAPGEGHR